MGLYKTGFGGAVAITGSGISKSWANAENIILPEATGSTIEQQHLSGLQVVPDGFASYGTASMVVPDDYIGSLLAPTTVQPVVTVTITQAGESAISFTGYIKSDKPGPYQRGQVRKRNLSITANSLCS